MIGRVWGWGHGPMSRDAGQQARKPKAGVKELEAKVDRLLLTCEALWSILQDKFGLTDLQLLERINDIDLSDGELDGKVRKSAVSCPKCQRAIARRFPRCMYCGQAVMHDPFA